MNKEEHWKKFSFVSAEFLEEIEDFIFNVHLNLDLTAPADIWNMNVVIMVCRKSELKKISENESPWEVIEESVIPLTTSNLPNNFREIALSKIQSAYDRLVCPVAVC